MKRRAMISLLCMAPLLGQSATEPTDPNIDAEETRLMKLAASLPKANVGNLRDYLRQKLDVAYEIALAAAENEEHRKAIVEAQEQWLEFYEVQRSVAGYNAQGGSMAFQASVNEGIYHLRHRIHCLVNPFLQGWGAAPMTPALKKP